MLINLKLNWKEKKMWEVETDTMLEEEEESRNIVVKNKEIWGMIEIEIETGKGEIINKEIPIDRTTDTDSKDHTKNTIQEDNNKFGTNKMIIKETTTDKTIIDKISTKMKYIIKEDHKEIEMDNLAENMKKFYQILVENQINTTIMIKYHHQLRLEGLRPCHKYQDTIPSQMPQYLFTPSGLIRNYRKITITNNFLRKKV